MVELDGCVLVSPSCESAKKKIGGETLTAKNAVEECRQQQAQNVVKQGDLEDELADLKSEDFKPWTYNCTHYFLYIPVSMYLK